MVQKVAIDTKLRVDPEHFEFLRVQKGNLDQYANNFAGWNERYLIGLREQFESIQPWLPRECAAFLDVGSGLGGIDVLIARHYQAVDQAAGVHRPAHPFVTLLDGVDDRPEMHLHRETFSNSRVARNFQVKNGVNPLALGFLPPNFTAPIAEPFDLIVSFGAWCFHTPPYLYLSRLAKGGIRRPSSDHDGTVLIVEVRQGKLGWAAELSAYFEFVAMLEETPKWRRVVMRAK